jgi:hypothetical protein
MEKETLSPRKFIRSVFRDGYADRLVEEFNTLSYVEQKAILLKKSFSEDCIRTTYKIAQNENNYSTEVVREILHNIGFWASLYSEVDRLCKIDLKKGGK